MYVNKRGLPVFLHRAPGVEYSTRLDYRGFDPTDRSTGVRSAALAGPKTQASKSAISPARHKKLTMPTTYAEFQKWF